MRSTFYTNMVTIPEEGQYRVVLSASTHYCAGCDNKGYQLELYLKDGKQRWTRCPDCVNRERGVPIPYGDLGLPLPKMEKL